MEFLGELLNAFGRLDFVPVADGQIHRFDVPGDRHGSKNGAYQLFLDGIVSGWYGTWKDGGNWQSWSSRAPAGPLEAEQVRQRVERARRHQEAAETALRLWRDAWPADPNHPYLVAKGCLPHRLHQLDNKLLVPLYYAKQLVNLQRIFADGTKWFLSGGKVKGCYSPPRPAADHLRRLGNRSHPLRGNRHRRGLCHELPQPAAIG
ncbi:hypothetical protein [Pseudomonas sp. 10C3]|uniref:hypothetical protein n=1 Tax=Pseudomonas sp. 10C3 TaxID=3118753 RepID=UPI002E7FE2E7|nr:hypothetical protein [Pseudomonas sp. 10C3]